MTFQECAFVSLDNKELVAEFDRLQGTNLSRSGTPFDLAIDDAGGRLEREMPMFVAFVADVIWDRIPHE